MSELHGKNDPQTYEQFAQFPEIQIPGGNLLVNEHSRKRGVQLVKFEWLLT